MRQFVNILLLIFGVGNVGIAQKNVDQMGAMSISSIQANQHAPEIIFTETAHDFGVLKKGSPVTCKFSFQNSGKEPLILRDCFTGCYCTSAQFSKDSIFPGATGFIEVHYDSTIGGAFKKELLVSSNARKPVTILLIKGTIQEVGLNSVSPN